MKINTKYTINDIVCVIIFRNNKWVCNGIMQIQNIHLEPDEFNIIKIYYEDSFLKALEENCFIHDVDAKVECEKRNAFL